MNNDSVKEVLQNKDNNEICGKWVEVKVAVTAQKGEGNFLKMKNHDDITTIGYMHAPDLGKVMVTNNKNTIELTAQGWIHF